MKNPFGKLNILPQLVLAGSFAMLLPSDAKTSDGIDQTRASLADLTEDGIAIEGATPEPDMEGLTDDLRALQKTRLKMPENTPFLSENGDIGFKKRPRKNLKAFKDFFSDLLTEHGKITDEDEAVLREWAMRYLDFEFSGAEGQAGLEVIVKSMIDVLSERTRQPGDNSVEILAALLRLYDVMHGQEFDPGEFRQDKKPEKSDIFLLADFFAEVLMFIEEQAESEEEYAEALSALQTSMEQFGYGLDGPGRADAAQYLELDEAVLGNNVSNKLERNIHYVIEFLERGTMGREEDDSNTAMSLYYEALGIGMQNPEALLKDICGENPEMKEFFSGVFNGSPSDAKRKLEDIYERAGVPSADFQELQRILQSEDSMPAKIVKARPIFIRLKTQFGDNSLAVKMALLALTPSKIEDAVKYYGNNEALLNLTLNAGNLAEVTWGKDPTAVREAVRGWMSANLSDKAVKRPMRERFLWLDEAARIAAAVPNWQAPRIGIPARFSPWLALPAEGAKLTMDWTQVARLSDDVEDSAQWKLSGSTAVQSAMETGQIAWTWNALRGPMWSVTTLIDQIPGLAMVTKAAPGCVNLPRFAGSFAVVNGAINVPAMALSFWDPEFDPEENDWTTRQTRGEKWLDDWQDKAQFALSFLTLFVGWARRWKKAKEDARVAAENAEEEER